MRRRWWSLLLVGLVAPAAAQLPVGTQGTRGQWQCSLDNIGASLTQCQATPGAAGFQTGMRYYITSLVAQSTTATGGQFLVETGTGSNCGTGTAALLPAAAGVARLAAPGNTVAPLVILFASPLQAPLDSAVCVLGVGTNTTTITLTGFVNP